VLFDYKPLLFFTKISFAVNQPRVAIIREEGSNGDREMAAAFHSGEQERNISFY
jgi:phosphoribosylformylglycinamidine synthase